MRRIISIFIVVGLMWINYPQTANARIVALTTHSYVCNLNMCIMPKRIEYQKGQIINGLEFIEEVEVNKGKRRAIFKCYCNNFFESIINGIKSKNTNSCGCYRLKQLRKTSITHGDKTFNSHHKYLYELWSGIKQRCYNDNKISYNYYGGRGIRVYNLWVDDYQLFKKYILSNLGERPTKNHSLDRINNDGNYEPSNIRWATSSEQGRNTRNSILKEKDVLNIKKELIEKTLSVKEIAAKYNVARITISAIKTGRLHKDIKLNSHA